MAEHIVRFAGRDPLRVRLLGKARFEVDVAGETTTLRRAGADRFEIDGHIRTLRAVMGSDTVTVFADGITHTLPLLAIGSAGAHAAGGDHVVAPMPGTVRAVSAEVGAAVSAGDAVIVIEAMKMELTLPAPRDGTVAEVNVAVGDQVEDGAWLVSLEPVE